MFIAIDIGNTQTVIGVYKINRLLADWRISNTHRQTENIIGAQMVSLLSRDGIRAEQIDGIGISSVVPHLTNIYVSIAKKYFHKKPLIVNAKLDLGITIHYDHLKSLGADRICNAIAGYEKYGGPLLIIDFGTATTYDVVASNGDYLGGVIAPGIMTSALSLHQQTAKLPMVELQLPNKIIGTNTIDSMQTGILWGAIDGMTGMVQRIQTELRKHKSKKALVIATGGFSRFVADHSTVIRYVEASLVLDGIRLIDERVHRKRKIK
jgi:type III pantothenate kinase